MNDLNEWGRLSFEKAPSRGRQLSIGNGYEVAALLQKKLCCLTLVEIVSRGNDFSDTCFNLAR